MSMKRIKLNMIKCNHCGDVIESKYCHDYQECKCGKVFVDGGRDYLRRGFENGPEDYTELSILEDEEDEHYETGEYIDTFDYEAAGLLSPEDCDELNPPRLCDGCKFEYKCRGEYSRG